MCHDLGYSILDRSAAGYNMKSSMCMGYSCQYMHALPARSPSCHIGRQQHLTHLNPVKCVGRVPDRCGVSAGKGRGLRCITRASASEASKLLSEGEYKYKNGDRMGALKLFEDVLKLDPSVDERNSALYNATCVHASFGDVELAQISLREGINSGLDLATVLKDPETLKMQAPPQVVIQLRKFAEAARSVKAAASANPGSLTRLAQRKPISKERPTLSQDTSELFATDMTDIDTSILGILKRVAILLGIAIVGGSALYYVGLKLTFPDY